MIIHHRLAVALVLLVLQCSQSKQHLRMERNFRMPVVKEFPVYWNVPTSMCHKYNISFYHYTQYWGLTANFGDQFRGDDINILYDPGMFPALLEGPKGHFMERNGGVPQMGNITKHLDYFTEVVDKLIPKNFAGVGVIDFEAWRPIFRQNWDPLDEYQKLSREVERQKHPFWTDRQIEAEAVKNFEGAARVFMNTTLSLVKILRPRAEWGYYAFPYCFNFRKQYKMSPYCSKEVQGENDRIQWLFTESTAIYPSIYLAKARGQEDNVDFVIGRLNEAWRVASRNYPNPIPVIYPYIRYSYTDSAMYLSKTDLFNSLEITRKYKMGGAIIWGSSNDVRTESQCWKLLKFVNSTLGPIVKEVRGRFQKDLSYTNSKTNQSFSSGKNSENDVLKRAKDTNEPTERPFFLLRMLRTLFLNQ